MKQALADYIHLRSDEKVKSAPAPKLEVIPISHKKDQKKSLPTEPKSTKN